MCLFISRAINLINPKQWRSIKIERAIEYSNFKYIDSARVCVCVTNSNCNSLGGTIKSHPTEWNVNRSVTKRTHTHTHTLHTLLNFKAIGLGIVFTLESRSSGYTGSPSKLFRLLLLLASKNHLFSPRAPDECRSGNLLRDLWKHRVPTLSVI